MCYQVSRESEGEHVEWLLKRTALLCLQMLGYKWEHCPLVGDQRTSCGLHYGMTDADLLVQFFMFINFLHMLSRCLTDWNVIYDDLLHIYLICVLFPSDQFRPLYWNNHHPGPEAAVPWYRRERIKHLPVSYNQQIHKCQCSPFSEKSTFCVKEFWTEKSMWITMV